MRVWHLVDHDDLPECDCIDILGNVWEYERGGRDGEPEWRLIDHVVIPRNANVGTPVSYPKSDAADQGSVRAVNATERNA